MTPTEKLHNTICRAIDEFEGCTARSVKGINLIRLDQPIIFQGLETDLINIEVTIK